MATKASLNTPTPVSSPSRLKATITRKPTEDQSIDLRTVLIINGPNDRISQVVADILGRPWRKASSVAEVGMDQNFIIGIRPEDFRGELQVHHEQHVLVINAHCVDNGDPPDPILTDASDYEFLYFESPFSRRDLTRFLSHILGQTNFHEQLLQKERSCFISTNFPDVRTALSNLDILTVGSDAVELRVDLLEEPRSDGTFSTVPSLKYVGEQVMLLRQRTELPLIYTTRCTKENGKFPMDDPELYFEYLYRAIQWGVEYIDVELWLPEEIRKRLSDRKGNSKIISAFHDFSGNWRWPSEEAQRLFQEGSKFGDLVKMNVLTSSMAENYDLEYFRSNIKSKYPHPPLSAVNMGQMGQLSRALNTVFTPITHPLLPIIAAPGQLSAAEINGALHAMGQLQKSDLYAIGTFRSTPQSVFFEKCFNELGLPHNFTCVNRGPKGSAEAFVRQPNFGGAYLNPPLASSQTYIPSLTDAAQRIGHLDTIVVRHSGQQQQVLIGDNATWKGIRATLTQDFVPSAYHSRVALILSSSEADAAAAIFALRSLNIGTIYTVGFKVHGQLGSGLEPFTSIESLKKVERPFVILSALPPDKSLLVQPLLRHYSSSGKTISGGGKVFVDLTYGPRKGDPLAAAASSGWTAYGIANVGAWTIVETLRLLVGHNVPFDFVRMASGRGLC